MPKPPTADDASQPLRRSTVALWIGCGLALLGVILFYARQQSLAVLALLMQEGLYLAFYTAAATLGGLAILAPLRRHIPQHSLLLTSSFGVGMGAIGLVSLLLGLCGGLNAVTAWSVLAIATAAGLWSILPQLARAASRSVSLRPLFTRSVPLPGLWPALAVYVGLALVAGAVMPGILWRPDDPHPYDVLIYHLQVPREWYELGRILPLEHNVYGYFPFGVEIHYLNFMHLRGGPWAAMYAAQLLSGLFTLGSALAVWSVLRPRSATAATLGSGAMLLAPWTVQLSSVAYVEMALSFYAAMTLAWVLQLLRSPKSQFAASSMAGVMGGLAMGVKLTALPMLVVPAALLALVRPDERWRRRLMGTGIVLAVAIGVSSPWLIRNFVWTGNPLFPVAMRQLGQGHFSDEQVVRFELAHGFRGDVADRFAAAGSQLLFDWRYGYVIWALAGLAPALDRRRESILLAAILLWMLTFWISSTHLQGRFFTIALPVLAMLAGRLPSRWLTPAAGGIVAGAFAGILPLLPATSSSRVGLHSYLAPMSAPAMQPLLGLSDVSLIADERLVRAAEAGRTLLFVGDGQMFLKPLPMTQMRYRTVFDVDGAGRNAVESWYSSPPATAPSDVVPVVNMAELERLRGTYHAVPDLAPADLDRFSRKILQ